MIRVKEAIVVEGRYDKAKLAGLVDGLIVETGGFGIFRDREKLRYLRELAKTRGLIVLTDSDGAGFLIRHKLASSIPPEQLKHAYIPDIAGKERRKRQPGKEGKLGVEGMTPAVLVEVLRRAGATFLEEGEGDRGPKGGITKADLYALGLSGGPDAARRRQALLKHLKLPEHMSANALLPVLNALYDRESFLEEAATWR